MCGKWFINEWLNSRQPISAKNFDVPMVFDLFLIHSSQIVSTWIWPNFMNGDKDCALAIKVGTKVFSVNDVGIDDHGDSHAKDGYCNVIKKVYVEGRVRGKSFTANKIEFPGI